MIECEWASSPQVRGLPNLGPGGPLRHSYGDPMILISI